MVKLSTITQANAQFANDKTRNLGLVCVFAGATSRGIGAGTIERLAVMLQGATFYVLGRSAERFASQRAKLESLNPNLKLVFLQAEVSLISAIDAASKKIIAAEQKVDYLYMSQAGFPINVPRYTKEGLDLSFSLQYYSRMRLMMNLLPLLRKSPRPRILSVLSAGEEKQMQDDDLGLENPLNYGWQEVITHTSTMMTLTFEYLAENDKQITFMHDFPGLVRTEIFTNIAAPESSGILGRLVVTILSRLAWAIQYVIGILVLDSGAMMAFILTSDKYSAGEAWRIGKDNEPITKTSNALENYRKNGWREKIWIYTLGAFEKALAANE